MLDFADAYTLWRAHPFPKAGTGDVLPAISGDLALADEYVTTVIRFVEKGVHRPAVPDVLALLRSIRRRIEEVIDAEVPEMQNVAREQRAYAALLELVYERFLAMAPAKVDPQADVGS